MFRAEILLVLLRQGVNNYLPLVVPNSLKGWDLYYHAYVIGAHKGTYMDHWNMPSHHTSVYLA